MALSFANAAGNLYNRLGRFGKLAHIGRTFQTDLGTYFAALLAQYDSAVASPLTIASDGIPTLRDSIKNSVVQAYMSTLAGNATRTLTEMVKADKPTSAASFVDALYEVYLQMVTAGASVKKCAVTGATAAVSGNSGDGLAVVTVKRGDGRDQELLIPELSYLRCTADSQTGGMTVGQEQFVYMGEVATPSVWTDDYPIGSGQRVSLGAIDATSDGTTSSVGNLLFNGAFETWTVTNVPDGWVARVGVAGTNFARGTVQYSGTYALKFIGSAVNTALYQAFDNETLGTVSEVRPQNGYAISFRAKVDVVPAAGVLTVELVDGNGTVINDDQGVANSFTVNLVTLGTSYASQTGTFRLPKLVPAVVALQLRASTALSVGSNLYVDHLAMGSVSATYPGGPGVAVFSGATKFAAADSFTVTTTNDYGGATNLSTIQWLLDRLFGTRNYNILMPSNNAPTVSDALITA